MTKVNRRKLTYRLREYGYRKFPSLFPGPDYSRMLQWCQSRDEKDNAQTKPPDDEQIELHCLWAVEFYTPSHVDKFLSSLASLGWDREDVYGLPNPISEVQRWRETSVPGGCLELGPIVRPGDTRFPSRCRTAPLPEHVEYAFGAIYNITSALTSVIVSLVFNDTYSSCFDRFIRQDYKTYIQRIKRGYRIYEPRLQKHEEIRSLRNHARSAVGNWFRENIAGLFSANILGGEFPTCEFVMFKKALPFPTIGAREHNREEYLSLLNMHHDLAAWISEDIPGLKFAWPVLREEQRHHAILAVNKGDFHAITDLTAFRGHNRTAYVSFLNSNLMSLLNHWALLALLTGFERRLNSLRDSTLPRGSYTRSPLRLLEEIGILVSESANIEIIATELHEYTKRESQFRLEMSTFKPSNKKFYNDPEITLAESLRQEVEKRVKRLQIADRSIRDLLIQQGTGLSAYQNIKLQKKLGCLTWIVVILTLLMAYTSLGVKVNWTAIVEKLYSFLSN
ncbi:MAG: hypothetical protein HYY96_16655 [Candidatus Tectomicrobia bacterium]|nr:hypothetical protein [Candidatus Tectomicrobia bacterium]